MDKGAWQATVHWVARDGHYHHKKRLLNGERLNTFPLISRTIQGLQVLATAIRQQFGLDRNKYICFMT